MHHPDEDTLTDAVLARLDGCADPRLKELLGSLVRHLHAFVRETRVTEAEWAQGIRFLTEAGHITDDKRQEFILLSDVLGVSMLTVAQNHAHDARATESTVFGPFHVKGADRFDSGADISGGAKGEPLFVDCMVVDLEGRPVADATVDVWQSDEDGFYDVQYAGLDRHQARGVFRTDAAGRFRFRSILPVPYPIPTDGPVGKMLVATGRHPWRPAHVHFMIEAPGFDTLVTHVFREGDPYLDSDVVFGVRPSLVVPFPRHPPRSGPHATDIDIAYHTLDYRFVLQRS